jgi:phosphoribosylamine--glycine ligase
VTVVLASATYPARGERGSPISGIANAEDQGALVFHAGTALEHGRLVTNGGRVLNVTAVGSSVGEARDRVYSAVQQIAWEGMRYRTDIAAPAAGVGPTRAGARGARSL